MDLQEIRRTKQRWENERGRVRAKRRRRMDQEFARQIQALERMENQAIARVGNMNPDITTASTALASSGATWQTMWKKVEHVNYDYDRFRNAYMGEFKPFQYWDDPASSSKRSASSPPQAAKPVEPVPLAGLVSDLKQGGREEILELLR